jgi:2-keto-4-pentenoate hydratase/2-oxohepta-3-ene-1,7-dioic acid hydratase in catechol pathway
MKIVRFEHKKKAGWGILDGKEIKVFKNPPFSGIALTRRTIALSKVKLLVPSEPSKIILVGLNYRDHAAELKMPVPFEPVIFLKPPTSALSHEEKIIYPPGVKRLDYEAELALVIKRKAKNIPPKDAHKYILGYTCLNDVTARDLQKKDVQWTRAKSFDRFCPVGPWIETDLNPDKLKISCRLNGRLKQQSNTSNFIFPVSYLVSFISKVMTLCPGDIISTGTPPGVGPMQKGDKVAVEIEGIGCLENSVI